MDIETHPGPHEFLDALYYRIHGFEPDFPSPSDLQMLGIQAFQANDETIKFDPCFFLPHPERLLQKYPLDDSSATSLSKPRTLRDPTPTLEDFLKDEDKDPFSDPELEFTLQDVLKDKYRDPSPDPEAKLEDTKARLRWVLRDRDYYKDEWYTHADQVHSHICQEFFARRKGPTGTFYPCDLVGQSLWSPKWRKGEPYTLCLEPKEWRVMEQYRYSGYRPPKPHGVISCLAHVCTTDINQGLATHELRAIVNIMVIRTLHRPSRDCQIHPILVLSYLGYKKARIIQAVYDGQGLTLQYSQLWAFDDEETAPVEMFVRYRLSQPIGLEVSTVCVR